MKSARMALALVTFLLATVSSGPALARGQGGHSGGSHSGSAHSGGSHFGGSHFSGRNVGRSHVGVGVFIGGPAFWYYPYPYSYYPPAYYGPGYYDPAATAVPYSPPTYIEQGDAQAAPPQPASGTWYYCDSAQTYYPYVAECPGGWRAVPATPTPPQPR